MECIDMWPLHHYHHILHCIFPHQTPSLTLFQATPHSTSHHRFSPYRTFHIDTVPHTIPICNTIQIAPYRLALHPIFKFLTCHIPCTLRHISDHAIYWPHHLCIAPPYLVAPHFTQDVAPHFTCSTACIIPPQSV